MDGSGGRGCTGMVTSVLNDSSSMAEGQEFKTHSSPSGHHSQTTTRRDHLSLLCTTRCTSSSLHQGMCKIQGTSGFPS